VKHFFLTAADILYAVGLTVQMVGTAIAVTARACEIAAEEDAAER
jgi:hypothetical protein